MEVHKEVLSNIMKYNYKFDKVVSANCKDLIASNFIDNFNIELLVPDMEKRLKVGEIFTHPWVLGFEKELEIKLKKEEEKKLLLANSASNKIEKFYASAGAGFNKPSKEKEMKKFENFSNFLEICIISNY